MQRRQFLKSAAALSVLPLLPFSGKLFAAPTSGPRFLLVFLRGGYDCNHLLVPWSSDFYYESRPTLAIAKPDAGNPAGAMRLDDSWALGPSVRDSIGALYTQKQVAFVPFAGTDDLSRSHFETQDDVESGETASERHGFHSGFMGRLAAVLGARAAPIAFTKSLPLSFEGAADVPNISLAGKTREVFNEKQSQALVDMYAGTALETSVRDGTNLRRQVASRYSKEMVASARGAVNPRGFAAQTERMAVLMRDQYRVGFVDVGGWDTHVSEGGASGQLSNNLANLGNGLAAYARALGDDWNNTTVVVISEFGRTFRENGNHGTDHGHGAVYWVMGGNVRGGRVAGEQLAVTRANLLQDRDYQVLNNYRDVFGGLFKRLWGLSHSDAGKIFPGATPKDLQLV